METPEFVDGDVSFDFASMNETLEGLDMSNSVLYEHEGQEEGNNNGQGEGLHFFQAKKREEGEEGVVLIKEYLEKCYPNIAPNEAFMSFLRGDSTHSQQGQQLSLPHTLSLSLQGPLSNEELGVMVEHLSSLKWNKPMGLSLGGAVSLSNPETPLFRWLGEFQFCVKELVLSSTQLTDMALKSLLEALEHSRTLQLLDLSHNLLTDKSTPNLSSFLRLSCVKEEEGREYPNVPLRSLDISGNQLGDNGVMTLFSFSSPSSFSCCLEKFVAQSVGMEEKGVMALAKFVNERAPLLHSLDLGGNQIGDEGGCILLDLLPCASSSSSPSSSSFAFVEGRVGGGVWRLALRGNMLGDNFAARCAHLFQNASPPLSSPLSSISRPSSLVEVSVGDNAFSPSVALEMLRALSSNSWVTLFDLQNINLGREGVRGVEGLLLSNSTLTHLVVDAVFNQEGEGVVVADAMEKNLTILDINFGDQDFISQPVLDRVQRYLLRNRQRKAKKDENLEKRVQKLEQEVEELKKEHQRGREEMEVLKKEHQREREEAEERWREREGHLVKEKEEMEEGSSSFVTKSDFEGLVLQIIRERERNREGDREEERKRIEEEREEQKRRVEEEKRLREEDRDRFERELEELREKMGRKEEMEKKSEEEMERMGEELVGLKGRMEEVERTCGGDREKVKEMERTGGEESERVREELAGLKERVGDVERKGEEERERIGGELVELRERVGGVEKRAGEGGEKRVGEEGEEVVGVAKGEFLGLRERVEMGLGKLGERLGEVERKAGEERERVDIEFGEVRERMGELDSKGEEENGRVIGELMGLGRRVEEVERRGGEERERVEMEFEGLKRRVEEEKGRVDGELVGLRERDGEVERKGEEGERRVMREVGELVRRWEVVERAVREGQKERRAGNGKEEQRSSSQVSLADALQDFSPQKLSHPTKSRPMVARRDLLKILQEKVGNNEKRLQVLEENKENNNNNNNSNNNNDKPSRFDLLMKEMSKPQHSHGGGGMGGMGGGVTHEVLEQRLRSIDHSLRSDLLCELGRVEADLYNTLQQDLHHVDARISSAFLCISTLGAEREREREREREKEKRARGVSEGRETERRKEGTPARDGFIPPPKAHHDLFSTPLAQQQYQKQTPTASSHHQHPFPSPSHQHSPPSQHPTSLSPSTPHQYEGLSLDAFLSLSNDTVYSEHCHSAKKDRHSTPSEMVSRGSVVSDLGPRK